MNKLIKAQALFADLRDGQGITTSDSHIVSEALERARVVAVLDRWATRNGGHWEIGPGAKESLVRLFRDQDAGACRSWFGPTPDAARAAAARAIESGEV